MVEAPTVENEKELFDEYIKTRDNRVRDKIVEKYVYT